VQAQPVSGISALAMGGHSSYALLNDGTVMAWGYNVDGQLGNGTTVDSNVPTAVSLLTGVTAIAGSSESALACKSDGTVWGWGRNVMGELGQGTNTPSLEPVQMLNITGATGVAGGEFHTLVKYTDGTVWSSGWNGQGQLGNGDVFDSNVPVQVTGLCTGSGITDGSPADRIVTVQPNPTAGIITVRIEPLDEVTELTVLDMLGREMLRQRTTNASSTLDLSGLPAGAYQLMALLPQGSIARSVIKR
jgi:hypothetical protein